MLRLPAQLLEVDPGRERALGEHPDTATSLLAIVEPWCPATGSVPFADAVDWLAGHIHTAALANGPIHVPFESLSNKAQAFRRAQATHLLARFGFRDVPALGVRDGGDPARQSPPSA